MIQDVGALPVVDPDEVSRRWQVVKQGSRFLLHILDDDGKVWRTRPVWEPEFLIWCAFVQQRERVLQLEKRLARVLNKHKHWTENKNDEG